MHKYHLLPHCAIGELLLFTVSVHHACSLNLLDEGGRWLGTRYLDY